MCFAKNFLFDFKQRSPLFIFRKCPFLLKEKVPSNWKCHAPKFEIPSSRVTGQERFGLVEASSFSSNFIVRGSPDFPLILSAL